MKYSKVSQIILSITLIFLMTLQVNSQMLAENEQDTLTLGSNLNELIEEMKNSYQDDKIPYYKLKLWLKQMKSANGNNFDANLRNPEIKRQQRYRQCYFNPISCFRK
ncbi:uncharacterized protein LOC129615938 [Condylostylus longicornis]|uniref:uncharacterized protein LOC129615938 n=1 Tax=Condylostylus longicornis TaxID=2530218 RepID=UPI00244DBBEC|nr:uncharacterized protein LOC129615938 [Condylostylus longicornis]